MALRQAAELVPIALKVRVHAGSYLRADDGGPLVILEVVDEGDGLVGYVALRASSWEQFKTAGDTELAASRLLAPPRGGSA